MYAWWRVLSRRFTSQDDSASVINLAPAKDRDDDGDFINPCFYGKKNSSRNINTGWESVSTDPTATIWCDNEDFSCRKTSSFDRKHRRTIRHTISQFVWGLLILALLGGVGITAAGFLRQRAQSSPDAGTYDLPTSIPTALLETSSSTTKTNNATEYDQEPQREDDTDTSNSCPSGFAPFSLRMQSVYGDGWNGAKISIQTLKAVEINRSDRFEVAHADTMESGVSKRAEFCLRTYKCYTVVIENSQVIAKEPNGDVDGDITWSLTPLSSRETPTYQKQIDAIAYGGAGARCTFAVSNSYEIMGCPNTCLTLDPTAMPTASPMGAPKEESPKPIRQKPTQHQNAEPEHIAVNTAGSSATRKKKGKGKQDAQQDKATITYIPGDLTVQMHGLILSRGLRCKIIAISGEPVNFPKRKTTSDVAFHGRPDGAGIFAIPRSHRNLGSGWIYVSNSELRDDNGGVGALWFDKDGNAARYERLLDGTTMNCGGGRTPWKTWISCEEKDHNRQGEIFEVDPFGRKKARKTVLGGNGGSFEAFAFDVRDKKRPHFFVTEDYRDGALRRFTPAVVNWTDPSSMLHQEGTMEYLILKPFNKTVADQGTYEWTTSFRDGKANSEKYFKNTEGISVSGNQMFFVSKKQMELFELDLDSMTWSKSSTKHGAFNGQPDGIVRLKDQGEILYFTEDGGKQAGVHGRDSNGRMFTILESNVYNDETTGLAFSPDSKFMYISYQKNGLIFAVWREDGFPFRHKVLNIKYHSLSPS